MLYNDLFDAMDALFEDAPSTFCKPRTEKYSIPQFPPCEMIKLKNGDLKISFALAKYKKEDIQISTEENRIIVSTVEGYEKPNLEEGAKVLAGGIKTPSFKNTFGVPETKFNFAEISATFVNGVLEITIPPKERPAYKSVTIA